MKIKAAATFFIMSTTALTSCTSLPSSGPAVKDVEAQATAKVTSAKKPQAVGIDYALVDLNKTV